jgi:hypothetical protein
MYEDPQDMFPEMDELFAHLYAQMTRDFAAGGTPSFGIHVFMSSGGETYRNPIHNTTSCGHTQNRLWKFTGLVMR